MFTKYKSGLSEPKGYRFYYEPANIFAKKFGLFYSFPNESSFIKQKRVRGGKMALKEVLVIFI